MKYERISQEKAEKIIVYGKGNAFSIVNLAGTNYTIYHRIYEDKYYDIAEMNIYDDVNELDMSVFYIFDPDEVKLILGTDPKKILLQDLRNEVV